MVPAAARLPGPQTKRHPEKGGKLNTSQAGSVAASRAAVGQFLSISREAFCLATRYFDLDPVKIKYRVLKINASWEMERN